MEFNSTINRALLTYRRKGYSEAWINQRIKSIEIRKDLTDEWDRCGIKGLEYASLTDIISQAWSGMTTRQYKDLKGLHKENLRDNMSNMELILNMLAEATTTELSKKKNPKASKRVPKLPNKAEPSPEIPESKSKKKPVLPSAPRSVAAISLTHPKKKSNFMNYGTAKQSLTAP